MPQTTSFGRRNAAAPRPPPPARGPLPAPRAAPPASDLSPEAEAFRKELASGRGGKTAEFSDWRRSQNAQRWLMWGATLLSFAPGIATCVLDAPIEISIGLEAAALVGNVWLRSARSRRMREIMNWEAPNPPR